MAATKKKTEDTNTDLFEEHKDILKNYGIDVPLD